MAVDIGTGATFSLATTGTNWAPEIRDMSHSGMSKISVDSSHMGTSTWGTFIQGEIIDPGEVTIEFLMDPGSTAKTRPPITNTAAETLTITFPENTNYKFTASCFCTGFSFNVPNEDMITGSATFKLSGTAGFSTS